MAASGQTVGSQTRMRAMPSTTRAAIRCAFPNLGGHPSCGIRCPLNPPNRSIRTRMYGGVGGEEPRGSPLSRFAPRKSRKPGGKTVGDCGGRLNSLILSHNFSKQGVKSFLGATLAKTNRIHNCMREAVGSLLAMWNFAEEEADNLIRLHVGN
jgi:hypothetical protein